MGGRTGQVQLHDNALLLFVLIAGRWEAVWVVVLGLLGKVALEPIWLLDLERCQL